MIATRTVTPLTPEIVRARLGYTEADVAELRALVARAEIESCEEPCLGRLTPAELAECEALDEWDAPVELEEPDLYHEAD